MLQGQFALKLYNIPGLYLQRLLLLALAIHLEPLDPDVCIPPAKKKHGPRPIKSQ